HALTAERELVGRAVDLRGENSHARSLTSQVPGGHVRCQAPDMSALDHAPHNHAVQCPFEPCPVPGTGLVPSGHGRTLVRMAVPGIVAHLDLDAFYAAVEELESPELRSRALVVGGDPHGRRVVATANYNARKFGIHSAMSCAEALRRCPQAVF